MTEPTRTRLAQASFVVIENERRILEYEPRLWGEVEQGVRSCHLAVVDAILDELMEITEAMEEVGVEAALDAGLDEIEFLQVKRIWQAILTTIREGK